jgi:hypothetical protein
MTTRVFVDVENPYQREISTFFSAEFPAITPTDSDAVLDLVTSAITTTAQTRYGPMPNPEGLVVIREAIRTAMENNKPIPVLVPWGSKKGPTDGSIDVAEVGALKQLYCLQRRVTGHYAPGIDVRLRIEDVSGYHLFGDEHKPVIDRYTRDMTVLIRVLGLDFVRAVPEHMLFSSGDFLALADEAFPKMREYLVAMEQGGIISDEIVRTLEKFGWRGSVQAQQRDFYRRRYQALYPGITEEQVMDKMASYFSGVMARNKLDGRGDDKDWGGKYVHLYFGLPVPGVPKAVTSRVVHYRTLPLRSAKSHLPPWRAKGYIKINGSNVCPKISTWDNLPDLTPCTVIIKNDDSLSVEVQSDYSAE